MGFLSGLFGGGDTDTTSASSNDLWSDLDAVVGLNISNESYSHEVDEDGSSETTYDSTNIGTDIDIGSMLDSMNDQFSSVDG